MDSEQFTRIYSSTNGSYLTRVVYYPLLAMST